MKLRRIKKGLCSRGPIPGSDRLMIRVSISQKDVDGHLEYPPLFLPFPPPLIKHTYKIHPKKGLIKVMAKMKL